MIVTIPRKKLRSILPDFYSQVAVNTVSNMMVPLAGLCDAAFLGHLQNIKYFAGVILASILFDYLYRTLKFLRNSTTALVAQAAGKNDNEGILFAVLRSGAIALAIAICILLLQYPIRELGFAILSGSGDIEASGQAYFNARIWGTPAVLLNFVLIGWYLGQVETGKKMVLVLAIVANGSNVLLDYLMIVRWGWASFGAGLATSISQYLALTVGLIGVAKFFKEADLSNILSKLADRKALKGVLRLNNDIFVRFLALISAYSIFTNFSASIGSNFLAQNGLLIQIALLSQFTIQGTGLAAQALIGKAKGEGDSSIYLPLITLSLITALPIALCFALSTQLFPETIFGLFGDHQELNESITRYTLWLLPLLVFTAITFIFEAYFIALKQGSVLRKSSTISFVAFLAVAFIAKTIKNIDLLWLSLCLYMAINAVLLGKKLFDWEKQSSQNILPNLLNKRSGEEHEKAITAANLIEYRTKSTFQPRTSFRTKKKVDWKIYLLVALSFLAAYSYNLGRQQADLQIQKNQIKTEAVVAARNLEQYLGNHYLQIQEMAAAPFLSDWNFWLAWTSEQKRDYFQNNFLANSEGMDSFVVIDAASGDTMFSGGTGTKTDNYEEIDYFKRAIGERRPVVIPLRTSTKTGKRYLYMAAPSFDENGNLLFVTRTRIEFDKIQQKIGSDLNKIGFLISNRRESLGFFLVDKNGQVIASENLQYLSDHINRFSESTYALRKKDLSTVATKKIENLDYFIAYSPVIESRGLPKLGWSVIVAAKEN